MAEATTDRNRLTAWSPTSDPLPLFVGAHLCWEDAHATVTLSQNCWRDGVWDGRELLLRFSHAPIAQVFNDGVLPVVGLGASVVEDSDWVAAVPAWVWLEKPAHYRFVAAQATIDIGTSFPPEFEWRLQPEPVEVDA